MIGALAINMETQFILRPEDVMRFKSYIFHKYPHHDVTGRANVLANAIHRVIDREIQSFQPQLRSPIRYAVLDRAINQSVFQVRAQDILFGALEVAAYNRQCLPELALWLSARQNMPVNVEALEEFLYSASVSDPGLHVPLVALPYDEGQFADLISRPARPLNQHGGAEPCLLYTWNEVCQQIPASEQKLDFFKSLRLPMPFVGIYLLEALERVQKKAGALDWGAIARYIHNSWAQMAEALRPAVKQVVLPAAAAVSLCASALLLGNGIVSETPVKPAAPTVQVASSVPVKNEVATVPQKPASTTSAPAASRPVTQPAANTRSVTPARPRESIEVPGEPAVKTSPVKPPAALPSPGNSHQANGSSEVKPAAAREENGLSQVYLYRNINQSRLKGYLMEKDSLLVEEPYFSTIIKISREYNINPLLFFAIAGQEQSLVPRSEQNAKLIANNPFNIYSSWREYNTDIEDSSRILANTLINLSQNRPANVEPLAWINRKYASDQSWASRVRDYFEDLERAAR